MNLGVHWNRRAVLSAVVRPLFRRAWPVSKGGQGPGVVRQRGRVASAAHPPPLHRHSLSSSMFVAGGSGWSESGKSWFWVGWGV